MRKLFAAVIFSVLFSSSAEAFVFSFTNSGIEWGWEGKKHFKVYQDLDIYIAENIQNARFSGIRSGVFFRWLQLGYNKINLNFSSGVNASIDNAYFTDDINSYTFFSPLNITALAVEPQFLFNKQYSIFLRFPLLSLSFDNWPIYGFIKAGFVSNIKIGISINFKGQENNLSSE
jgi:hypothetical protein